MLQDIPTQPLFENCSGVLETQRLVLRRPALADVKAIALLANDRRIAENTRRLPHPYTMRDAEDFVTSLAGNRRETTFAIETRERVLIGLCGLSAIGEASFELGYWLGFAYWGHGYGTEAVRGAIDYAFETLDADSLVSGARVANPASRRILEKCGFQWTGVELHRFQALGFSTPVDRLRLPRHVWASLRQWQPVRRVA
ncbi:MAG: N-acetyltransferase [Xanthobacteraceae bacterium]|nr:MAG: N-acetyltransferase [Xanthobacteraceae bacterium]